MRALLCLSTLTLSLGVAASPLSWDAPRYVAFGEGSTWVLVEVHSRQVTPLNLPKGFVAEGLDVAADGRTIVFTARDNAVDNIVLFRWDRLTSVAPQKIGDRRGYHADPSISMDGKWVYFAHNPDSGGPPGQHPVRAYAQLYRVRLDGTGLEPLTSGNGCHFAPAAADANNVVFVYTPCTSSWALSRLRGGKGMERLPGLSEGRFNEIAASPDGHFFVSASHGNDATYIQSISRRDWKVRDFLRVVSGSEKTRVRFGIRDDELLFQANGKAWVSEHSAEPTPLLTLPATSLP